MEKTAQEREYYKTAIALFFALIIGVFVFIGTFNMTGNIVLDMDQSKSSILLTFAICITIAYFVWMFFRVKKIYTGNK